MKKLIVVGFVCFVGALFAMNIAFAGQYKGKAFPEQQVVRIIENQCAQMGWPRCAYLGKFKSSDGSYNVYFAGREIRGGTVFQLDTGIWLITIQGSSIGNIVIQE